MRAAERCLEYIGRFAHVSTAVTIIQTGRLPCIQDMNSLVNFDVDRTMKDYQ